MFKPECIYSNRVESLYDHFADRWLEGKGGGEPFARRVVLVTSPAMREWLCRRLAVDQRFGIAAGLEIAHVESALETWAGGQQGVSSSSRYVPSCHMLALAIELLLYRHLRRERTSPWKILLGELWGEEIPTVVTELLPRQRRRLTTLAAQLATLFDGYGSDGADIVLHQTEFKKEKSRNSEEIGREEAELLAGELSLTDSWQGALWRELFAAYPMWSTAVELFAAADVKVPKRATTLHLFAIDSLPTSYLDFVERLADTLPVYCYFLSPCQAFWGDAATPLQQSFILKKVRDEGFPIVQQQALEELLTATNPLLACWGKAGRAMACRLASKDSHPSHAYGIAGKVELFSEYRELLNDEVSITGDKPPTLLEALQADIVLLRYPEQCLTLAHDDRSLQLHAAPSRWREVQVLYDAILNEVARAQKEGVALTAEDILIVAPDIGIYAPYLEAIFGAAGSMLPVDIVDPNVLLQTPYCRAFLHLLDLSTSRWEAGSLLLLLEYTPFRRATGFSSAEVRSIQRWVEKSMIIWGYDREHRIKTLEEKGCRGDPLDTKDTGSWVYGIGRLLEGLVMEEGGEGSRFHPCLGIEATEAPLLGRWIACLEDLKSILEGFEEGIFLTVEEWVVRLRELVDSYLEADDAADKRGADIVEAAFSSLMVAATGVRDVSLPFSALKGHLVTAMCDKSHVAIERTGRGAISCSSMSEARAVPYPIIAVLGMQDSGFPRQAASHSCDLIVGKHPTAADEDRYLFLETILSVRRTFIASCVGSWQLATGEQHPSSLLIELLEYLKLAFRIGDSSAADHCCYEHPLAPYHSSYFCEGSKLTSYSSVRYEWALAFYRQEKLSPHRFFSNFSKADHPVAKEETVRVTVDQLKALARAPLSDFFKNVLKAPLRRPLFAIAESIMLEPRDGAVLRCRALIEPFDSLMSHAMVEGLMPSMPLGGIYAARLQKEVEELHKSLGLIGMKSADLVTIELSDYYQTATYQEGVGWKVPALTVELQDGRKITIEGKIPQVAPVGLIAFSSQREWYHHIRHWPLFLVYNAVVEAYQLPFGRDLVPLSHRDMSVIKPLPPCFHNVKEPLASFVDYYLYCRRHPSPLQPDWVPAILTGDGAAVDNAIVKNEEQARFGVDDYILWLLRSGLLADGEEIVASWHSRAHTIYGTMARVWGKEEYADTHC